MPDSNAEVASQLFRRSTSRQPVQSWNGFGSRRLLPLAIPVSARISFEELEETPFPEVYFAKTNAAAPCISGTYQGWMGAYIVSTPGWVPPIQIQSGYGPAMYVTC